MISDETVGCISGKKSACQSARRDSTARLVDLEIMALDCQTTGATPQKGKLLEIGWQTGRARATHDAAGAACRSFVVTGDHLGDIPKAVRKITGIDESALQNGITEAAVWRQLIQTAEGVGAANRSTLCPTVIHYARFETPFLQALHQAQDPQRPFPFHIICSHAIALRLVPNLPRRGLRALAGFFGHSVPEQRRSGDHALATFHIWRRIVAILASQFGVQSLHDLEEWLSHEAVAGAARRVYPMNPLRRRTLPDAPGVYRLRRSNGDLLYVGKAKSLKKRVNSYFRPATAHAEHIMEMLTQARDVEVTPTASALEAALLEVEQIQRCSPPYNRALRDHCGHLLFFSRDLMHCSHRADANHFLGPLPESQTGKSLMAFGTWIDQGMPLIDDLPESVAAMLNLTPAYEPEPDCLLAGFNLFRERHGQLLSNLTALRAVIKLGVEFWRKGLRHRTDDREEIPGALLEDETVAAHEKTGKRSWPPEAIERLFEERLRCWGRLLRRARFLGLLCESSLAWAAAESPQRSKHLIVLAGGKIMDRTTLPLDAILPLAPGHARPLQERRADLDLATYNQLRVLTTELRRILAQGRTVELRIGPRSCLSNLSLGCLIQCL